MTSWSGNTRSVTGSGGRSPVPTSKQGAAFRVENGCQRRPWPHPQGPGRVSVWLFPWDLPQGSHASHISGCWVTRPGRAAPASPCSGPHSVVVAARMIPRHLPNPKRPTRCAAPFTVPSASCGDRPLGGTLTRSQQPHPQEGPRGGVAPSGPGFSASPRTPPPRCTGTD